jgi:dUTP pyrophosphatase
MTDEKVTLKCYRSNAGANLPKYATNESACFDIEAKFDVSKKIKFFTASNKEMSMISVYDPSVDRFYITIKPGDRVLIPTGIIFDISTGYSLRIHIRSSLALTKGLMLANSEGVVDSDYFNETFIMITNVSTQSVNIYNGDRIAQGELVPNITVNIIETEEVPCQKTDRVGGFGSTGV